ncbi:EcsC family protein [Nocardioides sp. zg-1228]|uniref:EcsC family protein n=1 Tax=Nocardioides sp. zg-1228 TaxID=2763008 RepID=UPI0016431D51|nr:EcsC family protein [Nocardioides sp. zg-1228]MBC2932030.1 EcsC family protein [Nocardioides sp. zg-1228]QSF57582.1 EcsC family protein [Nocardioides sp. zg-1228]
MGLKDLVRRGGSETSRTSALDAAGDPRPDPGAVDRMVALLLDVGLDGRGPLSPVRAVAGEALRKAGGDREKAIAALARRSTVTGGVGGFVTGIGGFVTMPVSLPVNVAEFYLQAVRMVGGIAVLRGHDIDDPQVRTAILLTLVGSDADEVLRRTGMSTAGSRVTTYALKGLPPAALMMVNKAVGFRLVRGVSEKALARLGRGVPVAGGLVGGGIDGWMMKKIADHAMRELPPVEG